MNKIIFFVVAFSAVGLSTAYGEEYGISLSRTCLTMIANNLPTNCPTYDEIMPLFPDNTDPALGEFEMIDGIYQRGNSKFIHPEKFYEYSSQDIMWIDPPNEVRKKIIMVEIQPSLPEYKTGLESVKMNDYSISFGRDRYVNLTCTEAKITAKDWVFLLGDTVNFVKHGCNPAYTTFNSTSTLKFEKSYQDIATSYKYQFDKWVAENLIKCKARNCQ